VEQKRRGGSPTAPTERSEVSIFTAMGRVLGRPKLFNTGRHWRAKHKIHRPPLSALCPPREEWPREPERNQEEIKSREGGGPREWGRREGFQQRYMSRKRKNEGKRGHGGYLKPRPAEGEKRGAAGGGGTVTGRHGSTRTPRAHRHEGPVQAKGPPVLRRRWSDALSRGV